MSVISLVAVIIAALGAMLFVSGVAGARHGRPGRLGSRCAPGCLLVAGGVALGSLALNLHTYARFTAEQPVAELVTRQLGDQRFEVTLRRPDNHTETAYVITGDEWQLDARVLRWRAAATLVGFDSRFRLERLSGRYADVGQAADTAPAVHDLGSDRGLDLWRIARRYGDWLPMVDATYGSAAYVPLRDGARWRVSIGRDGLIVRAGNDAADRALARW